MVSLVVWLICGEVGLGVVEGGMVLDPNKSANEILLPEFVLMLNN